MITLSIECTDGSLSHKTIETLPTLDGYYFVTFLMYTGNSIGICCSYQGNSHDVWVYGRITGTAVVYCIPLFIKR